MSKQINLLKRIIMTDGADKLNVDLSGIEKIITQKLPAELGKNAPPNFPELYFDFKQEYERFKEFILFEKLIGKNVVALGGGFSSGKSSFLNSFAISLFVLQILAISSLASINSFIFFSIAGKSSFPSFSPFSFVTLKS